LSTKTEAPTSGLQSPAAAPPVDGRFLPGTILARRFRIVNLLGRGGMGEVYRATDLILGQTVALKFLPEAASFDIHARERLSNEVRAAREITHPHVCRVHDIGEIDGQLYISMEYVDGEDLASLLSRIGRLPAAKASELAAGICAGLAAAHRKGLVHRDLKPANIMVDGRGQPRLMDFGLAASVGHIAQAEVRNGTPAYMAPEQLAGKEVTVRSDLYALGLILYELFTGKRPFEGQTIEALLAAREKNAPPPASALCPEMEPQVESMIAACLSPDPARRPASAHMIAAALPYTNALAAVIAAGDTPSPELIAASGDAKAVRPALAYGAAGAILCGLLGVYLLKAQTVVVPEQSPEVLANSARTLAGQLGYTAKPAATDYGFVTVAIGDTSENRFWYREGDAYLRSTLLSNFLVPPGRVTSSDPPLEPGMLSIETDTRGRLVRFTAIPRSQPQPNAHTEWKALFDSSGLDLSRFTETSVVGLPPVSGDTALRWTGQISPNGPERVVTAESWMGQAVYFQVIDPPLSPGAARRRRALAIAIDAAVVVLIMAGFGVLFFARRNLRQQRGDRKGAFRVGAAMFWISVGEWLLVARHSFSLHEAILAACACSWALAMGALACICYVAVDPALRWFYPDALVSLQKTLTGAKRDAMLGRDILFGLGIAVLMNLLQTVPLLGAGEKLYTTSGLTSRGLAGLWLTDLRTGAWVALLALTVITPLSRFRRKRKMRFGVLGIVIAETGLFFLKDLPGVPDVSAWYAPAPLLGYAALAAVTLYGARLSAGSPSSRAEI
jgi:Protein kinase domain